LGRSYRRSTKPQPKAKKEKKDLPPYQAPPKKSRVGTVGTKGTSDLDATQTELAIQRDKGRGDQSGLLTSDNPTELLSDIKFIDQAISKRVPWNVKRKDMLVQRLTDIAAKKVAQVAVKGVGLVDSETEADKLSVAAVNVLAKLDMIDQKDHIEANKKPDVPQPGINIGTLNVNNTDDRRSHLTRLLERFGTGGDVVEAVSGDKDSNVEAVDSLSGDQEASESSFSFTPNQASSKTS
jgi:hypothetical protein